MERPRRRRDLARAGGSERALQPGTGQGAPGVCAPEPALRLGVTDGHPSRGTPHPPQPCSGFGSRCGSPCRAPRCPQSRGDERRSRPSLSQPPPASQPLGVLPAWRPPSLPPPPPDTPATLSRFPAPPSSPMFPSMETFLRRFWKLDSREPAGLWQCRLAGVDMAVPSGNSRGSQLLQRALSVPPASGRDGRFPPVLSGKRRKRCPLPRRSCPAPAAAVF